MICFYEHDTALIIREEEKNFIAHPKWEMSSDLYEN